MHCLHLVLLDSEKAVQLFNFIIKLIFLSNSFLLRLHYKVAFVLGSLLRLKSHKPSLFMIWVHKTFVRELTHFWILDFFLTVL